MRTQLSSFESNQSGGSFSLTSEFDLSLLSQFDNSELKLQQQGSVMINHPFPDFPIGNSKAVKWQGNSHG